MPDSGPSAHALGHVEGAAPRPYRVALADRLGTSVVDFPGDHVGFVVYPEQCGRVLHQVLGETPS